MGKEREAPRPIAAKLTPPDVGHVALRVDTLAAFRQASRRRLLLVCAPAGYGKTCVTGAAMARITPDTIWYKLDKLDRDPVVFFSSLALAFRKRDISFEATIGEQLQSASERSNPVMEMASVFVSECCDRITRDVHVVLDDYHEAAETSGINLAIDYMLANLPREVHIAVLSRYDPGFSLSKVRLADGVAHVGVELLRFNAAQAAAVVESLTGRRPKRRHITRLVRLTEGWPASIVLAALTMHRLDLGTLETALADPRLKQDIYSYLAEQVYRDEGESARVFLKRTSCLETVTPALANRLGHIGDAHIHLDRLAANRVFTFQAEQQGAYRYHNLFRDFLQQKYLRDEGQDAYDVLQRETAAALEDEGERVAAIELLFDANEPQLALDVIARAGEPLLEESSSEKLHRWLEKLPPEIRAIDPWAKLLSAQLLTRDQRFQEALLDVDRAIAVFDFRRDGASLYHALSIKECTCFWSGDMQLAASTCRLALRHACSAEHRIHTLISLGSAALEMRDWAHADEAYSEAERLLGSTGGAEALRVGSLRALATFLRGDFATAREQMMPFLDRHMPGVSRISIAEAVGMIEMGLGNHAAALQHFKSALEITERHGCTHVRWSIVDNLGACLASTGQIEPALLHLRQACTELRADPSLQALCLSHIGTLFRRHGDLVRAQSYYAGSCDASIGRDPYAYLNSRTNRTLVRAVAGDRAIVRDRAVVDLSAISDEAAASGLQFVEHKAALFKAILLHYSGQTDEAASVLGSCVPEQMRLGHLNFLGQEMTLQPGLLSAFLVECENRDLAEGLLVVIGRHWNGSQVLCSLASTAGSRVARLVVESAATRDLGGIAPSRILNAACRHADPRVRQRARSLLSSPLALEGASGPLPELTPREYELLSLIAHGRSNAEIAGELFISPSTVKTHINHIFSKLGVINRVQAILRFTEQPKR